MKENEWKKLIILLFGGWLAIWVYRSMLTPVYEEIQMTIGTQSNASMGMIASFYFLGYTLMQIPSGIMVHRLGQKRVIIPGFILLAVGTLVTVASGSLTSMYMGSILAGTGCGTFYGAAFSLTAEYVPTEKKGLSAAVVNSGCSVGLVTGLLGSGLFVKRLGFPWQVMGLGAFGLTILMTLLFIFLLKDGAKEPDIRRSHGRTGHGTGRKSFLSIMSKQLAACSILYFATCYVYYLIITWLPDYLASERGLKGGILGVVSALICITAVPGGLYFARLSDQRPGSKGSIVIFLEMMSVLIVTAAMMAPNTTVLSVFLLLYGFLGKISVDPVLISCISDFSDTSDLALALGIFNCCGMSGSIIAPILTGYIKDLSGSGTWGFYIGAMLLAAASVCYMCINRTIKIEFRRKNG